MKKISIIIPVYNSEKYIEKCLNSILKQKYTNYEIIIVNDGSKDNSQVIIDEFVNNYPEKIKAFLQENKGVSVTRNEAILKATGDYIMFVDNDDFLDDDYLETYINEVETNDYDIVLGGYKRVTNEKILKKVILNDDEWAKFVVMAPWAKLYKTSFLVENNTVFLKNNIGEDVYFNLKAVLMTDKIKIINYAGYNWFFNTESVSNTNQKNIKNLSVYNLLNNCYEMLKKENLIDNNYNITQYFFVRYIIWLLLFSTKGLNYKDLKKEYNNLFLWLFQRFPKYKKIKVSFFKPKSESKSIRILMKIFLFLHKFNLGSFFVFVINKILK